MRYSKTLVAAFIFAAVAALAPTSARAQQLVQIDVAGPAALNVGDVQQYSATGTLDDQLTADLTQGVSWVSSDETVAVVNSADQAGQVTAVGPGEVTISAYGDEGVVGSVSVVVEDPSAPQPDPSGSDVTPLSQP